MPVEYFLQNQPQHSHEKQAVLGLAQQMQRAFGASDSFYLLAANARFWNTQADALVFAPHAITLIELKSCSDPIYGRPRGSWHAMPDGGKIRGGSHDNPYQQIAVNRGALIKYLDRNRRRFLTGARAREMARRWGHVSAALVFCPHFHPDSDVVVPPESRAWLGVLGLNQMAEFLFSRSSTRIDLRPQELRRLAVEVLGCQPWTDIETLLPPTPSLGHLWLLDDAERRTYALPIIDETTVGRSRDNALVVPRRYSRTSRHHARLTITGDVVRLHDDDSTHGTFVNGEPVMRDQGHRLCNGDDIALGDPDHPGTCHLCFERRARSGTATQPTATTQS